MSSTAESTPATDEVKLSVATHEEDFDWNDEDFAFDEASLPRAWVGGRSERYLRGLADRLLPKSCSSSVGSVRQNSWTLGQLCWHSF